MKQTTKLNINMNKSKLNLTNRILEKFTYENVPFCMYCNTENILGFYIEHFKVFVMTVQTLYASDNLKNFVEEIHIKPKISILESIILLFYQETANKNVFNNLAKMQKSSMLLQKYIYTIYILCHTNIDVPKSLFYSYLKMPLEKAAWERIRNNSIKVCKNFIRNQLSKYSIHNRLNEEQAPFNTIKSILYGE